MVWPIAFCFFQVTAVKYLRTGVPQTASLAAEELRLEDVTLPSHWPCITISSRGNGTVVLSQRLPATENVLHEMTPGTQMGMGQGRQEEGVANLLFLLLLSLQKKFPSDTCWSVLGELTLSYFSKHCGLCLFLDIRWQPHKSLKIPHCHSFSSERWNAHKISFSGEKGTVLSPNSRNL